MKIYLATPYTGYEKESFKEVNKLAGKLINEGYVVFSPISHSHPIATECNLSKKWSYWKWLDICFIHWCDQLYISSFGNWKKSEGVKREIGIARTLNKPVHFME